MKNIITFFLIILFSSFIFNIVSAVEEEKASFNKAKVDMQFFALGLNFLSFEKSTTNIISSIMLLVNTIFFIFMIYAGVLWLSSAGVEEKISKAKSMVFWCAVGMAVTLSAYSITMFVLSKVGG